MSASTCYRKYSTDIHRAHPMVVLGAYGGNRECFRRSSRWDDGQGRRDRKGRRAKPLSGPSLCHARPRDPLSRKRPSAIPLAISAVHSHLQRALPAPVLHTYLLTVRSNSMAVSLCLSAQTGQGGKVNTSCRECTLAPRAEKYFVSCAAHASCHSKHSKVFGIGSPSCFGRV